MDLIVGGEELRDRTVIYCPEVRCPACEMLPRTSMARESKFNPKQILLMIQESDLLIHVKRSVPCESTYRVCCCGDS